jgi:phage shock protein PspC (stress-responsive transcriptional regulator)
MIDTKRPIQRSRQHRMLGGVLGGLADWLGCDPSVARVGYIFLTAFTGFALGVVAYAVLWIFLPVEEVHGLHRTADSASG